LPLRFNAYFYYKTILDKAGIFLKFILQREDKKILTQYYGDEILSEGGNRRIIPGFRWATKNLASKNCMRSWTMPLP